MEIEYTNGEAWASKLTAGVDLDNHIAALVPGHGMDEFHPSTNWESAFAALEAFCRQTSEVGSCRWSICNSTSHLTPGLEFAYPMMRAVSIHIKNWGKDGPKWTSVRGGCTDGSPMGVCAAIINAVNAILENKKEVPDAQA